MSGISGILALDGSAVSYEHIREITAPLERRGPDGTRFWWQVPVAMGHTLLATTPEALVEEMPFTLTGSGCTITADVRLDNRADLIRKLCLDSAGRTVGDGELLLRSYLAWGEDCLNHFIGEFAFCIWDARQGHMFCARDKLGVRQFTFAHKPGRLFVFATEPAAVVRHNEVPDDINEGRVADFLADLEGIDLTSTFFNSVQRLPPAHCLTVGANGCMIRRYWTLEVPDELRLSSNEDYAAAFLDVFTEAVRCRLRSAKPVGSMLSGGMDSGSVTAVAAWILASEGRPPLQTFSAVSPEASACPETKAIMASLRLPGIAASVVSYDHLQPFADDLMRLAEDSDEPFDGHMTLMRLMYLMASRSGVNVLLDGGGGDIAFNESSQIAHLMLRGKFFTAIREARV